MPVENDAREKIMDGRIWEEFCDSLKTTGKLVIEAAPENAFDRAEGLRYLGRLTRYALGSFLDQRDPAAPHISTDSPKIGGDNPDYVYGGAPLNGSLEYRLSGNLGDAHYLGIGTYSGGLGTEAGLQNSGYLTGSELATDDSGSFEIIVSCREHAGNWLPMKPETNALTIRQTVLDRRHQQPATFSIERIDASEPPAPLDPEELARALASAGGFVNGVTRQFLEWTRAFARYPNEIRPLDPALLSNASGDPNTFYQNGYYDLASDEVLEVDFTPPRCEYWNFQLCNHWLESLDFWHHTIHVNGATATAAKDGSVHIVIAHRDPGVPNWLDTAGHSRGGIAVRWVGAAAPAECRCRVRKLSPGNPS